MICHSLMLSRRQWTVSHQSGAFPWNPTHQPPLRLRRSLRRRASSQGRYRQRKDTQLLLLVVVPSRTPFVCCRSTSLQTPIRRRLVRIMQPMCLSSRKNSLVANAVKVADYAFWSHPSVANSSAPVAFATSPQGTALSRTPRWPGNGLSPEATSPNQKRWLVRTTSHGLRDNSLDERRTDVGISRCRSLAM